MLHELQDVIWHVARTEVMPCFLNTPSLRKEDGPMFSGADLVAQTASVVALSLSIGCPMPGEEMTVQQQAGLWYNHSDGLWIANPIDSTNNFINGLLYFAASVAYVWHGHAQLDAIYNPVSGECFYAERGRGAFLNGIPFPLRLAGKKPNETIAGVEIKYLRSSKLSSHLNTLAPFGTIRSMGSSTLNRCYLACGCYDVYVYGGQKLWDYATGVLIFEEVGGCLSTLEGDDFWSGEHVFRRLVVVALQPDLFEKWLKWIRENQ